MARLLVLALLQGAQALLAPRPALRRTPAVAAQRGKLMDVASEGTYGKRAIRATRVGGKDVLTPEPAAASFVLFAAFECYLSSQQCAEKARGDLCALSTIRDWNPDLVTGGFCLLIAAVWLFWYGTFRRVAVDPQGLEIVAADTFDRDPTGKVEPSPRSWAWGGPDRVNFRDVDDWGILPAGVLYVREVAKTASGAERRTPWIFAPTFDTKTIEQLMEAYGVPKADPSESVLGQGSAAGAAGVVSYIAWEWAFWIGSFGVAAALFNLYEGHWPDLRFAADLDFSRPLNHFDLLQVKGELLGVDLPAFPLSLSATNGGDFSNIAASAFVIVNLARLILPLRLALALATAPFFQRTVVGPFQKATGQGS